MPRSLMRLRPVCNSFKNNCVQCHGADGNGRGSKPAVHSARIAGATDGDLYWLLKNGQPFRGMPSWTKLPEGQRWQIVAYLRSIQPQTGFAGCGWREAVTLRPFALRRSTACALLAAIVTGDCRLRCGQ